jgi:hypothetical protein
MTQERLFRFNPFKIMEWSEEELILQYNILEEALTCGDTPMELSNDIDLYANMGYLIGEMVARYSESVSNDDVILKTNIANEIYRERDQWVKEKVDKAPAMAYFESKALSKYIKESIILNQKEASLKRFKIAFESIQDKQNALKKKMESIKFDTFGR